MTIHGPIGSGTILVKLQAAFAQASAIHVRTGVELSRIIGVCLGEAAGNVAQMPIKETTWVYANSDNPLRKALLYLDLGQWSDIGPDLFCIDCLYTTESKWKRSAKFWLIYDSTPLNQPFAGQHSEYTANINRVLRIGVSLTVLSQA